MTISISKSKLKARTLGVFRQVEETEEELIVTDKNRPVLRIIPVEKKLSVEEVFKDWQGKVIFHEDQNTPTLDEWGESV